MFRKKQQEKQVIQEETPETNPMQELAKESEEAMPPAPQPPIQEQTQTPIENEGMRWVVGEIATASDKVIHDKKTQMNYDIYQAIALILNKAYQE